MRTTCNFLILSSLLVISTCRPEAGYQYPSQQQQPFQHSSSPPQTYPAPQIQQSISSYLPPNPGFSHSAPGLDLTQSFQNHHGQGQRPVQHQQGGFSPVQSLPLPGSFNLGPSLSSQNQQGFNLGPNHQQVQLPGPQFSVGNQQSGFNPGQNHPQVQLPGPQLSVGNQQSGFNPGQNHPQVQLPGPQLSVGNQQSGFNPGQNHPQVQLPGPQLSVGNQQSGFNPGQNYPQVQLPGPQLSVGNQQSGFNAGQNYPQVQLPGPQFSVGNQQLGFNPGQNVPLAPQNQGNFNFPQNLQLPSSLTQGGFGLPQGHLAQPQSSIITKHVYVHVAPEEPQAAPQAAPAQLPPQKHYKIVFIKAPTQQSAQTQVVHAPAAQQIVEEKTLIYVLVNKAKQPEIVIPPPAPTQPSKPEVYFIKYKANNNGAGSGPSGALPLVEDSNKGGRPENSGESTSSLFSGGLGGPGQSGVSNSYGPPGYKKRSA